MVLEGWVEGNGQFFNLFPALDKIIRRREKGRHGLVNFLGGDLCIGLFGPVDSLRAHLETHTLGSLGRGEGERPFHLKAFMNPFGFLQGSCILNNTLWLFNELIYS